MAISRRETAILVGGLLLGVAGAWALFAKGPGRPGVAAAPAKAGTAATAPAAAPTRLAIAPDICAFNPVVPSAGDGDGTRTLDKDVSGKGADDIRALLVDGKEAAASGHRRDAETAFLTACRAAGRLTGDNAVLLADAVYRLGRHYAGVEGAVPQSARAEVHERARTLHASALEAYRAKYGEDHEKTRFAANGLDALGGSAADAKTVTAAAAPKPAPKEASRAPVVQAAPPTPVAPPAPAVAAARPPEPVKPPVAVAAAPRPAPAPAPAPAQARNDTQRETVRVDPQRDVAAAPARRARPSFDCDRARSTTERIICADDDLARQDRELGGLHARAKAAAADQRDFQRRSDAEWSRREATCTDRECLQRWYAQRREALSREATAASAPREPQVVRQARVAGADDAPRVAEPVRRPAVTIARPAVVAPTPAPEAAVGQATGDAGDVSQ